MIDFRPITLADKATIESYTRKSTIRNCDLSFANIYAWQPIYKSAWAEIEGYLVIRFYIDGGAKIGYMQPIDHNGGSEFAAIIPRLAEDAHRHGNRLRIIGVTEQGRESLTRAYGGQFAFHSDPNFEDYIYTRTSLTTLAGKALQPKRNHINQFLKRYPNYTYRPLTSADKLACLRLDERWREAREQGASEERVAMERAFESFEELELQGGALFVEGEMVAFTYGSRINTDTFCTHIEKGLPDYQGCYPIINRELAASLAAEFEYINREEDLGVEGLRRAKLSYYPDHKQVKYTAIFLHKDESECRGLWSEVFGDEEEFIDEFLLNHYSQGRMLRVTNRENSYLSMLHIVPFESSIGRVAYIYGVATHPHHRSQGYATQLLRRALEMVAQEGFTAAMLIPSEESLWGYYAKFGFTEGAELEFESYNNFDFGNDQNNHSMVWWADGAQPLPPQLTLRK